MPAGCNMVVYANPSRFEYQDLQMGALTTASAVVATCLDTFVSVDLGGSRFPACLRLRTFLVPQAIQLLPVMSRMLQSLLQSRIGWLTAVMGAKRVPELPQTGPNCSDPLVACLSWEHGCHVKGKRIAWVSSSCWPKHSNSPVLKHGMSQKFHYKNRVLL
jgi:hypothetical protein